MSGARIDSLDVIDCELSGCGVANLVTRRFTARRTLVASSRLTGASGPGAELSDMVFEDCDLTGVTLSGSRFARSELRSCALDGLTGVDALRGVAMSDEDAMSLARVLAAALGIRRQHDEASH